ncbi:MAG: nucleotide exchange factor GrpE [Fidelibacterota bacterium]
MSSEDKKTKKSTRKKPAKPRVSKDKQQIKKITEELKSLEEKHLRLKAEFENFRRRKEREIQKMLEYEGQDIFADLLPIVDDLDRSVKSFQDGKEASEESLKKGITMIHNKFEKFLSNWKLKPFGESGDTLNAEIHDALMIRHDENAGDDEILEVFEKGYTYKDRVIRHAKVVVNKS